MEGKVEGAIEHRSLHKAHPPITIKGFGRKAARVCSPNRPRSRFSRGRPPHATRRATFSPAFACATREQKGEPHSYKAFLRNSFIRQNACGRRLV